MKERENRWSVIRALILAVVAVSSFIINSTESLAFDTTTTSNESQCNLEALNWLVGQWQSETKRSTISEKWQRLNDDNFQGLGVTRHKLESTKASSESLRLVNFSGNIFFIAKVAHNEFPVPFKLITCSNNRFVFENKSHDFPKVIEYHQIDDKHFEANVSDGESKGFTLVFTRML